MSKYTVRQYRADIAANEAAAADVAAQIAAFTARHEAGEDFQIFADAWNAAYDRQHEIEEEGRRIECRFRQRNWTWQDHSFASLVLQNID